VDGNVASRAGDRGRLLDRDPADMERVLGTNVVGAFATIQAFYPLLKVLLAAACLSCEQSGMFMGVAPHTRRSLTQVALARHPDITCRHAPPQRAALRMAAILEEVSTQNGARPRAQGAGSKSAGVTTVHIDSNHSK